MTLAGGLAALSQDVERALAADGYATTRLAGAERYATAAALVRAASAAGAGTDPVVLASGADFPDALAAVPTAVSLGGITVLVDPDDLGSSVASRALLAERAGRVETVLVAGGPAAVAQRVVEHAVRALARG